MALKDGKIIPTFDINGSCSNDFSITTIKQDAFQFVLPPEAPVFRPTEKEFLDPLAYIDGIRHIAEKSGICKIIPPPNWQPPFAVDVDKLKFTPRIQRLNELEAKTRIKLNFLDQIAKFWELQGSSLKIPMVEKRALDLYTLHSLVKNEGGFTCVTDENKWTQITVCMGYPQEHGIDCILKTHYERLLYPFELSTNDKKVKDEIKLENCNDDMECKPRKSKLLNSINKTKRYKGKGRRSATSEFSDNKTESAEMYGTRSRNTKDNIDFKVFNNMDPLGKYACRNCHGDGSEEQMLLCDGCNDGYHTFCLIPPLTEIPKGDWFCPKCVIAEVSKPTQAFGFEQAQKEYNLQQFGEMADTFKTEYFQMPGHLVPTSTVEREFWRIVSSIDEDVVVEYGADLHTMDHGSGFPTKDSLHLLHGDQEYAYSGWNLNNLPILQGSILGHIKDDISGMSVPWMYVGMCFAAFCWHNEDHWTYSINYLHWGEPKTWYGVPGAKAEIFEKTMKQTAPELFHNQPDLLHQLVTIMNPNTLMNSQVPVFRTDQRAGEFVITFPRAYHAGFNQGYNFAEAVNFAPADWVAMGRLCVLHYSQLRRYCVFSHDELICKMATNAEQLDITVAAATYTDMLKMVEAEKKLRKSLLDWGVTKVDKQIFELLPDDARQCELCKTTCYMSALICSCTTEMLVCLKHYSSLCKCAPENHTLLYRYTLDELLPLLHNLKQKAESFDRWVDKVTDILNKKTLKTATLSELNALLAEGNANKFPKTELLQTLSNVIEDAKKCMSIVQQLDLNKSKHKVSLQELQLFYEEIESLACILDERKIVKELLDKANHFESKIQHLLQFELDKCPLSEVDQLVESSKEIVVDFPSLQYLIIRQQQLQWIHDVYAVRKNISGTVNIDTLKEFVRAGLSLPSQPLIENMISDIQAVIAKAVDWEERAQILIKNDGPRTIKEAEDLIKAATDIVYLPTENILVDNVNSANEWFKELEKINLMEFYPYLSTIHDLVEKSKRFIFQLDEVDRLKTYISLANNWKDNTAKIFMKKNVNYSLVEALSPRIQHPNDAIKLSDDMEPTAVVSMFKDAADREFVIIKNIRKENLTKTVAAGSQNTFCICRKGAFGIMMQCELCKDWFHNSCVKMPKLATYSSKNIKQNAIKLRLKQSKFLCPICFRTKRPRLDTILALLKSLQILHNRLAEGEALQCLTERAMNWQDRAEQLLQNTEVIEAMGKIKGIIQKYSNISCAKLRRINQTSTDCEKTLKVECSVTISATTRIQIEELTMEGDLLEVSLQENDQLWSVLFMCRDMEKDPVIIDFNRLLKASKVVNGNRKGSKRRSEEAENLIKSNNKKVKGKQKSLSVVNMINPIKSKKSVCVESEDEESNDVCAAMTCLQLTGDEVNWLQCDGGCEQWFHMTCLGLSIKDIKEDEDYICSTCSLNKEDIVEEF